MVKRILALLFLLLLLAASALGEGRVRDDAGLYNAADAAQMEQAIERIRNRYQIDLAVWTTYDIPQGNMSTTRAYADQYYEDNGFGMGADRSGVVFVVDMNNRNNYLSTAGVMIDYLNDSRVESVLSSADDYLYEQRWASAMMAEIRATEGFLAKGIEEGNFRYDEVTGERLSGLYNKLTTTELLLALGAGAIVALIIIMSVRSSYQLRGSTYKYDLSSNSQRNLTLDNETFLRQTVSTRRIVRDTPSSSGGGHSGGSSHGSSVHISSGGMSHGGGGHHF